MKYIYEKHKEFITYAGFGCGTVALNFLGFYVCYYYLGRGTVVSNMVAWVMAVTFAFITNKLYVFESKSFEWQIIVHEAISFFGCRALTGAFDVIMMYETVDKLQMDAMLMKTLVNIIVIALNYVVSKKIVFKEEYREAAAE